MFVSQRHGFIVTVETESENVLPTIILILFLCKETKQGSESECRL